MKSIEIKDLFNKYIKRECSKEELLKIVTYFKESKDFSDVPTIGEVSKLLEAYPDLDEEVANRIYNKIIEINKKEPLPIKNKKIFPILKYAAAAVLIGILATAYFFRGDFYNAPKESTPIIVDNNIKPGTDRATLTLENGAIIPLEKGSSIQTQNAISNGKKITYKNNSSFSLVELVYNYLTVPRGGQFFIELSDGTKVWLNSESQLKYPVSFIEGQTREVELVYGEAYFEVTPSSANNGSKFKVLNKSQQIEVLGTEFNIKAYRDESNIYTTLVKGKVLVENKDKQKQYLSPNQQANLNLKDMSIKVEEVDAKDFILWKDGIFSFKEKSLKDIMKVISRWYDVDVIFENKELGSLKFKGVLDKQLSIEDILSIMKSSTINSYEIKNKTIILR
ncbi:FecR family protein [Yeosuana marina]|uniref:FecR family protein n=1 Tax=Yeosuana marina TaxID=1565536 RepID=UPI0030C8A545